MMFDDHYKRLVKSFTLLELSDQDKADECVAFKRSGFRTLLSPRAQKSFDQMYKTLTNKEVGPVTAMEVESLFSPHTEFNIKFGSKIMFMSFHRVSIRFQCVLESRRNKRGIKIKRDLITLFNALLSLKRIYAHVANRFGNEVRATRSSPTHRIPNLVLTLSQKMENKINEMLDEIKSYQKD